MTCCVLPQGAALPRPGLETPEDYRRDFAALDYWRPYVAAVCAHHGLPCVAVRGGVPGTCPTWIVDDRYVVKFFGRLFGGGESYVAEAAIYDSLVRQRNALTPELVARGELCDGEGGWPWPYLVSSFLSGRPLAELYGAAHVEGLCGLAQEAGAWLRGLHALPVSDGEALVDAWAPYLRFLAAQRVGCGARHLAWGGLPAHLAAQVDGYLSPLAELADVSRPPVLVHADLTEDHLLGEIIEGRWRLTGVIDFGDARLGDRLYELGALHLGAFRADKRLLHAFLLGYGDWDLAAAGPRRVTSVALLYQFDLFGQVMERYPWARQFETLDELARRLWALDEPGMEAGPGV